MKCSNCGAENAEYSIFCGKCGRDLPKGQPSTSYDQTTPSAPANVSRPPAASRYEPEMKFCSRCGKKISAVSYSCPFCGERPWGSVAVQWDRVYNTPDDYRYNAPSSDYYSTDYSRAPSESNTPTLAGVLAILAGVLAILQGLLYMSGSVAITLPGTGALCLCGAIGFLLGLGSIMGGVCALKRENFGLAILGALCGMFGLGFIIGGILGFIALLAIAFSDDEFSR